MMRIQTKRIENSNETKGKCKRMNMDAMQDDIIEIKCIENESSHSATTKHFLYDLKIDVDALKTKKHKPMHPMKPLQSITNTSIPFNLRMHAQKHILFVAKHPEPNC